MDESTDRGVVKCEGTLIRYYDESTQHIATVFWGGGYKRFLRLMLVTYLTAYISTLHRLALVMKS